MDPSASSFPMKRLKHVVSLRRSRVDSRDGEQPYVGLENIESWTGRLVGDVTFAGDDDNSASASETSLSNMFEPGDVLFGKLRPYLAKAWVADFSGCSSTEFLVMQPVELEPRFLRYVCVWQDFVDAVDASTLGSKMPRAEWDYIGTQPVPLPTHRLQHAIANYLDRETSRINALLGVKERLLGLLAEKHRALITRAVTRGLDPKVPLRDSGIPWLGKIPAHWEVWKLGHTAQIGNGSTPNRGNAGYWLNGTIPWLTSSVVNQYEVTKADEFVTEVALQDCHLPLVKSGSVLIAISGQGMTRGQAVVLSFEATVNQHLAYVETDRSRLDSWFLRWVFLVAYEFLRSISDDAGGTRGALTCADITSFRIPIPPVREQSAIATYVSKQVRKLDELRTVTEKSISILKERRTALIAAAVTGQTDVGLAA